ncbi:MAG: hypothetical protein JSV90_02675 [Methanobacteriota archaeon]|nr:MAG: hypothetical protein JSV90_02675 [Euryarchaeota archaeon]
MDPGNLEILREAASIRQKKETAERAVSRAARRLGRSYGAYISAMSDLRNLAARHKVGVEEALGRLLQQEEK